MSIRIPDFAYPPPSLRTNKKGAGFGSPAPGSLAGLWPAGRRALILKGSLPFIYIYTLELREATALASLAKTFDMISYPAFLPTFNMSTEDEAIKLNPTKVIRTATKRITNLSLSFILFSLSLFIVSSHIYRRKQGRKSCCFWSLVSL